jgi:hypothetical protein
MAYKICTWKEFKDKVDAEIKKQGKDENIIIDYIDIHVYPSLDEFDIYTARDELTIQ